MGSGIQVCTVLPGSTDTPLFQHAGNYTGRAVQPLRPMVEAEAVGALIVNARSFDVIYLMLFSHGADSIGLVPIDEWRTLLRRAARHGDFHGVDPSAYPRDFAVFSRYHRAFKRIPGRYAMPRPLGIDEARAFIETAGSASGVRWIGEP
jgi:hypothetical protein